MNSLAWLQTLYTLLGTGVIVAGAIVYQTHYIDKRIEAIDKRIDELKTDLVARIDALDKRVSEKIDALEKRLVERIERLEHPVLGKR